MIRIWRSVPLLGIAVALAALPPPMAAQEPVAAPVVASRISLEEALRRFETGNLELRMARDAFAAAEARVVSAGAFPNPGMSATREELSGEAEDYHETVVALGQTLEIGGQRAARRQAAVGSAEAAAARLASERLRLAFDVHRAFVEAAVAEANLSAMAEATEVFRRVEESGQARYAEGDISRFDRSRLQVERARYETLLARTRLALDENARVLALLVAPDSLAAAGGLLPAESLPDLEAAERPLDLDAALAVVRDRPDVRAVAAEVEAARAALSLARRERVPDVTLSAGFKEQAGGLSGAVLGVSLPVPLWNRNQGEIRVAEAELNAARARRELALARARSEILRAWDTHRSLRERMRTLGEMLLPESAGLLETARVAYAEGEMSLIELLDAADAYRSAREAVNELLGDYLISLYDLQRATGTLLEPADPPTDAISR